MIIEGNLQYDVAKTSLLLLLLFLFDSQAPKFVLHE